MTDIDRIARGKVKVIGADSVSSIGNPIRRGTVVRYCNWNANNIRSNIIAVDVVLEPAIAATGNALKAHRIHISRRIYPLVVSDDNIGEGCAYPSSFRQNVNASRHVRTGNM